MLGVLDRFWTSIVRVLPLKKPFRLFNPLFQTYTYNHLLRWVTFTQLTILHANIPYLTFSHTLRTECLRIRLETSRKTLLRTLLPRTTRDGRLPRTLCVCLLPRTASVQSQSQSQSHIATDDQSVSKSWCRALSGAYGQIFITVWQLWPCFCGAPSLTRGRVCLLSESLRALVSNLL
jgi:hypothetical protein